MAQVQDIKRRIRSVRNTRKITKAMELVAGAACGPRPGSRRCGRRRRMELMVGTASQHVGRGLPLLQRREIRTAAISP